MRVTKFIFDKWRSSSRKGLYAQNSDGSFKVNEETLTKINDLAIKLVDYDIKSDDIVSLEQIQELEDLLFNLGFSDFSDPFKGSTKLQYLIKNGTIDVPFSPHIINNNEMITIRDKKKNIRIIKKGKVPIPDRCFEYERAQCDLTKDTTSIVNDIIHDIGIMQ